MRAVTEAPAAEDMYEKNAPRPPRFTMPLEARLELREFQPAHLESRLVPIGDPAMNVEWFKDGQPIRIGTRFRPTYEFSYVALDILWSYPEDSGTYYAVATNLVGTDSTSRAELRCTGTDTLID